MKRILITGAHGFLGRNVAILFKKQGLEVVGIGHGDWGSEKYHDYGIDLWIEGDLNTEALNKVAGRIDLILHCAGGSNVGQSIMHPLGEFSRTLDSTLCVLEYVRNHQHGAKIIYPSSAAVYGNCNDYPICEGNQIQPVSQYGLFKKIAEELLEFYSNNYGIPVTIIRFFSIYGIGLKKQLLWDASNKFISDERRIEFYGTGSETRDWLDIRDASDLIWFLSDKVEGFQIYNGGSGIKRTVKEILSKLSHEFGDSVEIVMNNKEKKGDPKHYLADMSKVLRLGWSPRYQIEDGLREYAEWFKKVRRK